MSETPESGMDQSTQKRGFFRRQFSLRNLRRALIGLAAFITLIALVVTEEDWRGKHDWESYRRNLEAKGERLDWQAFVPATVPDDQNLFTSPVFKRILDNKISISPYPKNDKNYSYDLGNWQKNSVTDFKPWQIAYRDLRVDDYGVAFPVPEQPRTPAADVLFALSRSDEMVEELSEASRRPYAIIPLPYKDGDQAVAGTLLPHLAALKRCAQILNVRAIAELADNQNQKALDEIELLFHLNNSLHNSPLLISELVQIAIMNIEMQPIWEGLAGHKWSDQQLAELETELSKMDFLAYYELSVRSERALAITGFDTQRRTHEVVVPLKDGDTMNVKMILMPSAYFYQNELAFAQMSEQWSLPLVDTNSRVISPENHRRIEADIHAQRKHLSLYAVQARMLAPVLAPIVKKLAFAQAIIDLARVGCALERYRLAHGKYPQTLDTLTPQFIAEVPHDIINGQPLHYRLRPDGQFILY
ncbi:MAG: hypothetical protein ABSF34_12845, partial [Verrucomicrobiota bacterium]